MEEIEGINEIKNLNRLSITSILIEEISGLDTLVNFHILNFFIISLLQLENLNLRKVLQKVSKQYQLRMISTFFLW